MLPIDTLILSTTEAGKFLLCQPAEFEVAMPHPPPLDSEIPVVYRHHSFELPPLFDPAFRYQDQIVSYQACDGIFENYLSISDSAIAIWHFEGMRLYPIAAIESQTESTIEFRALHYTQEGQSASDEHYWTFEEIGKGSGIWLLSMLHAHTREVWTTCWIDHERIQDYARVICDCPKQKQLEWNDWNELNVEFLEAFRKRP